MVKMWLISGAVFAMLAVILGAFGAHALKSILSEHGGEIYQTAVQYQMYHGFALIAAGLLQQAWPSLNLNPAGWCFIAGIMLFSGSLYILAGTSIRFIGMITPVGGLLFIGGWLWIIVQLVRAQL